MVCLALLLVMLRLSPMSGGWYNCRLVASRQGGQVALRQLQQDRDSAVVVLSLTRAQDSKDLAGAAGPATATTKDNR